MSESGQREPASSTDGRAWKLGESVARLGLPPSSVSAPGSGPGLDALKAFGPLLVVVVLALYTGLTLSTGGNKTRLLVILTPILVMGGLFVLRFPLALGQLLLPIFYSNIDGVASIVSDIQLAIMLFGLSMVYYITLIGLGQFKLNLNQSSKSFLLMFGVMIMMASAMATQNDTRYESWIRVMLYGLNAFIMMSVVVQDRKQLDTLIVFFTWTGVILSAVNIAEFFDRSLVNLSSVGSRSAGLLLNANPSAAAIVACTLISYLKPQRYMFPARIIMFLGMYTTFSRAGIAMFFLLVFYNEVLVGKFTAWRAVVSSALISALMILALYGKVMVEWSSNKIVAQSYERILAMAEGRFDDNSTQQRQRVIPIQLARFAERPLLGWGGGAALGEDSPHNQVVAIMVDHGVVGLMLFLAHLAIVFWRIWRMPRSNERSYLLSLYASQLMTIPFTHNMFTWRFYIEIFAFLCVAPSLYDPERKPSSARSRLTPEPHGPSAHVLSQSAQRRARSAQLRELEAMASAPGQALALGPDLGSQAVSLRGDPHGENAAPSCPSEPGAEGGLARSEVRKEDTPP